MGVLTYKTKHQVFPCFFFFVKFLWIEASGFSLETFSHKLLLVNYFPSLGKKQKKKPYCPPPVHLVTVPHIFGKKVQLLRIVVPRLLDSTRPHFFVSTWIQCGGVATMCSDVPITLWNSRCCQTRP